MADEPSGTLELIPPDGPAAGEAASRRDGLDAKREHAVALLLQGRSVTEVAGIIKVHRSTVHRWRTDPDFERELSRRRDEFLEKAFDLQAYASALAVHKLIQLLDSKDERVALRAAQTLGAAGRVYVLMDQERRIRRIEDNLPFLSHGGY